MKPRLFNFVKRFKWLLGATAMLTVIALASGSNWFETLTINHKVIMKTGSYQVFNGASYQAFGDSSYLSVGALVADTNAFTTTSLSKAIYISGATAGDAYFISKRLANTTSPVVGVDSLSYSYVAKTDSLIVVRSNSNVVSGAKFSYFRVKLR